MDENVLEMFSRSVSRFPHKTAIESFGKGVTYAELAGRSDRLARLLVARGAERGSPVAIISDDQIQVIISILAILKSGCAFMPLDPTTPETRLRTAVGVTEARWFISDSKYVEKIMEITRGAKGEASVITLDGPGRTSDLDSQCLQVFHHAGTESFADLPSPIRPDEMCYIFFTSGSTGEPKAIAGQMKGISHFVNWEVGTFAIDETARVSQLTTPSFDAILRDIFTPLVAGGTVCIPPGRDIVLNSAALVAWLDGQGVTLLHCVPSVFRSILNYDLTPDRFKALRHVLLSGEPMLPYDVKRWTSIFGDRTKLVNLYGPSETTMTKLFYMVRPSDADRKFVPIGKPMTGAEALVLDDSGRPCGVGEIGEIYIRTPFRTLGYYNRPDLTNDVFVLNPSTKDAEDVLYKTGDLGRLLEDGDLEYLGRRDRQVKIRGVRVELAEVENVLLQHDSVGDAAVIDRKGGDGGSYLCAYVVMKEEAAVEELTGFLARHLPSVMIPTAFITLDKLPRTISGKLNRALLPAPHQSGARRPVPYVAPRSPMEHAMARIWSDVLQISSPGITENFFTIGGHSLLVMEVFSRVERALGAKIGLQDFLANPTIKALAEKAEMAILAQSTLDDDLSDLLDDLGQ
jgi:amino acid adenylation domain-containing protein